MSSIRVERGFAWEEHKCAIFIASYHLCSVLFIWHLNIWFLALVCVRLVGVISLRLSASYRFYLYLSYFASYILLSILIHLHGVKKLGGDLSLTFLQIVKLNIVLSSNTKKGEIERTFLSLSSFVCLLTT